jgi:uncharacterized membrane protein
MGSKTEPKDGPACTICGRRHAEIVPARMVRGGMTELIRRDHPEWGREEDTICLPDLNRYRARYLESLIAEERGELSAIEADVIQRLHSQELVSIDTNQEFDRALTVGERISDRVARFGGSWAFIISFGVVLVVWMAANALLLRPPFDPYPFILLNLVLSSIAALQAPVIMMSQNRQEAKDRLRAEYDYRVNLKAELEIRLLAERVDALVNHQWQRLLEIQRIQIDLMEQLSGKERKREDGKS